MKVGLCMEEAGGGERVMKIVLSMEDGFHNLHRFLAMLGVLSFCLVFIPMLPLFAASFTLW